MSISKETLEKIAMAKSAIEVYRKYNHTLPKVLDEFDVEFSYPEILGVVSQVEANGAPDTDEEMEVVLRDKLTKKAMLHGSHSDIAIWIIFILDYYRRRENLEFNEMHSIFGKYDVYSYLCECYPVLHTASEEKVARMLDKYIDRRKQGDCN